MEAVQKFFKALRKSTNWTFSFVKSKLKRQIILLGRFKEIGNYSSVRYVNINAKSDEDEDDPPIKPPIKK